jgi:hypothetical protein
MPKDHTIYLDRTAWSVKKGLREIRCYSIKYACNSGQGQKEIHEVKKFLII